MSKFLGTDGRYHPTGSFLGLDGKYHQLLEEKNCLDVFCV